MPAPEPMPGNPAMPRSARIAAVAAAAAAVVAVLAWWPRGAEAAAVVVHGTVTDLAGRPLAEAWVTALAPDAPLERAFTAADGTCRLRLPRRPDLAAPVRAPFGTGSGAAREAGTGSGDARDGGAGSAAAPAVRSTAGPALVLEVRAAGHVPQTLVLPLPHGPDGAPGIPAEPFTCAFALQAMDVIEGRLVGPAGPLADVALQARGVSASREVLRGRTRWDGTFRFPVAPGTRWDLLVDGGDPLARAVAAGSSGIELQSR